MKKHNQVTMSSGNVFADIGIPNPEEYLAKAKLAARICEIITKRRLTEAQAAKTLGLDRPQMSDLRRGLFDDFSAERLFRFLNLLGQEVEIIVRPAKPRGRRGDTRVVAAAS